MTPDWATEAARKALGQTFTQRAGGCFVDPSVEECVELAAAALREIDAVAYQHGRQEAARECIEIVEGITEPMIHEDKMLMCWTTSCAAARDGILAAFPEVKNAD